MIKFTPINHIYPGGLTSPDKSSTTKGSFALSLKLEQKFSRNSCEKHPDVISEIEVDMLKDSEDWLTIKYFCCADFNLKLMALCDGRNPFRK